MKTLKLHLPVLTGIRLLYLMLLVILTTLPSAIWPKRRLSDWGPLALLPEPGQTAGGRVELTDRSPSSSTQNQPVTLQGFLRAGVLPGCHEGGLAKTTWHLEKPLPDKNNLQSEVKYCGVLTPNYVCLMKYKEMVKLVRTSKEIIIKGQGKKKHKTNPIKPIPLKCVSKKVLVWNLKELHNVLNVKRKFKVKL